MHLLDTYLPIKEFNTYDDFKANFSLNIPEGFNFAFDIVDKWAEIDKDKVALLYEDDFGISKQFTFKDISELSNRAANYFTSIGIKKGDVVMLTLKRRYQFWYIIVALHKIGAIAVPATEMLKAKDYEYRFKAADVKMVISVGTEEVLDEIDLAVRNTGMDIIKAHESAFLPAAAAALLSGRPVQRNPAPSLPADRIPAFPPRWHRCLFRHC